MLVVVLNEWVTETKETPWASNVSTRLRKSASDAGQPIELIDDDHIDPSRSSISMSAACFCSGWPTPSTRRKSRRRRNDPEPVASPRALGS